MRKRPSKPLVVLKAEIKSPPLSQNARREIGFLLRELQDGELLSMPHSEPMKQVGPQCHCLRVKDANHEWRIIYRIDDDAIVLAAIFDKKTPQTPDAQKDLARKRLAMYDTLCNK